MPRGLNNWTFSDVVRFLKDFKFQYNYTKGSHYFYVGRYNGALRNVCVPFHGSKSIHPKTMKGIVTQSGIPKDKWISR